MTPKTSPLKFQHQPNHLPAGMLVLMILFASLLLPGMAFAQTATETTSTTCGFFNNIGVVLNAISIIVVTIAIIFTGYKVAFAHARISEVAPVLIGAILIGAASQIAKMFLGNSAGTEACQAPTAMVAHIINNYASVAQHLLAHYA
jgi:type IV secretion system protein VirB2